jgi:hypothetical protein
VGRLRIWGGWRRLFEDWQRSLRGVNPMMVFIKRPKGIKQPTPGWIDRNSLRTVKRSSIRFTPFANGYPGVRTIETRQCAMDATFRAEVESLLQENAELLRRLAR